MRSTYGRILFSATVVMLLALLVVGISLRALLNEHLTDKVFSDLEQEAEVVGRLTASFGSKDQVSGMDYLFNLDTAMQLTDSDAVICDPNGQVLLCSDQLLGCKHQGMAIGEDYVNRVIRNGNARDTGYIQGLYEEARYIYSVPVYAQQGKLLGVVVISRTTADAQALLDQMTDVYLPLAALVIVVSMFVIALYVRRQTHPLHEMARTARSFGHGNLDARVDTSRNHPREVEELALAFNNMASSLQKSEYQRQEFVANVSHELKTPMTTIGGYVDGILDGTIPPEKSRQYLQIVSDETKRLSRLVRSMLDISQLQTEEGIPEEKKSRFDLCEAAGQVLITFERKITSKGVEVEVEMPEHPVFTFANADYVTQVIYNLLDNAVKFCPEGGTVGLRIQESDHKAHISIYNDGETIPPEELPLLFDRFHKLDKSRSQNRDGWGLGLYIVRTIVCSHGENISVSSRDGRTAFTFTMPLVI